MAILGATSEVATLKQALSVAEKKTAAERTEREKHEVRVGEVQEELFSLATTRRGVVPVGPVLDWA